MTSMELLELLGSVRDKYVVEARSDTAPAKTISLKRTFLIAAVIALTLLLVGCTVAYVNGWFTDFFSARSQEPLSDSQIQYIQEHEQIIQESQTKGGWTIELKSAMYAGDTAYIIFGITAPEDIDLEEANITTRTDSDEIIPGNSPSMVMTGRGMFSTSLGIYSKENNVIWQHGCGWKEDNDGKTNTLLYVFNIRAEKAVPYQEILLENPFASDIEFYIRFKDFIHTWEDAEKRQAIEEKYAGQDYMIDGEEMEGLYQYETLIEEEWEFTITFDTSSQNSQPVELVTGEPVMTWGLVTWKLDNHPIAYDTGSGMAAVKITSFVLNSFGATVQYEFEEPAFSAFIEYQNHNGYTDRYIYAVMKDGSKIALHTDGTGDQLAAETPIVLSEVDYILLGSGEKLPMP